MIYLYTGRPGAGKTLRAITDAMALVASGREVFEVGVNRLNHAATGIKPWEKGIERWTELPTGAVLLVDECQRFLPVRAGTTAPPQWIEEFTRNRHLGVDILLVTQDPRFIDSMVRRLVEVHYHLETSSGLNGARFFRHEGVCEDIAKPRARKNTEFSIWPYPKQNFALYHSADAHTKQRRVPRAVWLSAAALVLVALCFAVLMHLYAREPKKATASAAVAASAAPSAASRKSAPATDAFGSLLPTSAPKLTASEFIAQQVPLVEGIPWSAPIFAGESPRAQPEIYCMVTSTRCSCLSEQGTRIKLDRAICESIAIDGLYNPFREPAKPAPVSTQAWSAAWSPREQVQHALLPDSIAPKAPVPNSAVRPAPPASELPLDRFPPPGQSPAR